MTEFLLQYAMFLLKVGTIVAAILIIVGFVASMARRQEQPETQGKISIKSLNKKYENLEYTLKHGMTTGKARKQLEKAEKKKEKKESADSPAESPRTFVLNFKGDINATAVTALREEITALLLIGTDKDEVLLRVESPAERCIHMAWQPPSCSA